MSDYRTVEALRTIVAETGIGYTEVAIGAGVSPGVIRHALATGEMPERSMPRIKIVRWIDRNRLATRRDELVFI